MVETRGTGALTRLADTALAHEIEFLTVKAFADGTRIVNARLDELGLRARSYSVLALACSGLDVTQRELAAALELDPSQIVALVDGLEASDLVHRVQDPRDRRSRIVQATPAGRALFKRAQKLTSEAEAAALAMLSDTERETLREILRKIVFAGGGQTLVPR
ncbi:MAG: MarR family winged helix-turn-helix transcriptional regulator [Trebonia sp.]